MVGSSSSGLVLNNVSSLKRWSTVRLFVKSCVIDHRTECDPNNCQGETPGTIFLSFLRLVLRRV